MVQFARREAPGVVVGDLLEFECAFQCRGMTELPAVELPTAKAVGFLLYFV